MEYALNRIIVGERVMVRYLLKQKGGNVAGKTAYESAMWMLKDGAKKHGGVKLSDEFEGYPLTADGVYFFDGFMDRDEGEDEGDDLIRPGKPGHLPLKGKALGEADAEGEGSGEGPGEGSGETGACGADWCEIPAAEIGADGLPIPAGTGAVKAKDASAGKARRKKRMKDVVCE